MPETQKRRRLPKTLSPVDMIMQRNELEARKVAVLEYVGGELAKLNALLADVGFAPHHTANGNGHVGATPPSRPVATSPAEQSQPCTWCGPGKPTKQYDTGGGRIQWMCASHAIYVQAQRVKPQGGIAAQAVAAMMDSTEPTYQPIQAPITNTGKIVMQPTEQDVRASQPKVAVTPQFEEIPDAETGEEV